MTNISPAAQAVLDTMHRSYDHELTRRALAAGVLRAAADQLRYASAEEAADWLDAIAAELVGTLPTSESD